MFFKVLEKSVKKIRPPSAAEKCEKKCEKFPRKYEKSPKKYKKHLKSTEKYEKKYENAKSAPSAPKSMKKSVNSHFFRLKKNTDMNTADYRGHPLKWDTHLTGTLTVLGSDFFTHLSGTLGQPAAGAKKIRLMLKKQVKT